MVSGVLRPRMVSPHVRKCASSLCTWELVISCFLGPTTWQFLNKRFVFKKVRSHLSFDYSGCLKLALLGPKSSFEPVFGRNQLFGAAGKWVRHSNGFGSFQAVLFAFTKSKNLENTVRNWHFRADFTFFQRHCGENIPTHSKLVQNIRKIYVNS